MCDHGVDLDGVTVCQTGAARLQNKSVGGARRKTGDSLSKDSMGPEGENVAMTLCFRSAGAYEGGEEGSECDLEPSKAKGM